MAKEKKTRNIKIFLDNKEEGLGVRKLGKKYKLHHTTVASILRRYKVKMVVGSYPQRAIANGR